MSASRSELDNAEVVNSRGPANVVTMNSRLRFEDQTKNFSGS